MQFVTHAALQGLINHLVLLHPGFTDKGFGNDMGRVMIPVTRKIVDRHDGTRKRFLDQFFDFTGSHGHGRKSPEFLCA